MRLQAAAFRGLSVWGLSVWGLSVWGLSVWGLSVWGLSVWLAAGAGWAQTPTITVVQAWARAPAGGAPAALYVTLHDNGAADELTSVSTDAAGMAMLHESSNQNGIETMRMLASVPLPAGGTVAMRPGGIHVMLMDPNRTLAAGQTLHATLTFAHAPPITVAVPVLPPGSPGPN